MERFLLEDCIAYLACRDARRLADSVDRRLAPHKMTRVQWNALYYIDLNEGETITQRQLADCMGLREPTMVRLIDRMEKNGLLKREPSKMDRRQNNLVLTKKGKETNSKLMVIMERFKEDTIKGIPESDLRTFKRVLNQMIENAIGDI